jgi:arylsulfatase A-like enzyme
MDDLSGFPYDWRMRFLLRIIIPQAMAIGWVVVATIGCSRPAPSLHAERRMVDLANRGDFTFDFGTSWKPAHHPSGHPLLTTDLRVAGIENDSRFVLAAPPHDLIVSTGTIAAPVDGQLNLSAIPSATLAGSPSILAVPSVRIGQVWTELAPLVVEPRIASASTASLEIPLVLPPEARGRDVVVNVYGYALVWGNRQRLLSPETTIPPGATMEFAVGLNNPGHDRQSTRCALASCTEAKCEPLFNVDLDPDDSGSDVPWQEVRIDLAAHSGESVQFEFSCAGEEREGPPRSFPLWAHPTIFEPKTAPAVDQIASKGSAQNVILVSLDTLSARHLDLYGYPLPTAPKMRARFESRGAVFEHCMAAATATAPSHMTMMTGLDPMQHEMTGGMGPASLGSITLAETLRAAGITTAAFTEDGWVSIEHGFGRGFDRFLEDRSPDMFAPVGRIESTFGRAATWLEQNRDKAFFLFLHTFEVHDPYHPPAAYRREFLTEGQNLDDPDLSDIVRERISYDQEIRYADDQLEDLLRKVEDLGLADSTLVVVTSDHGEAFGEHGSIRHGNFMHEEVLHVPLVMAGPGVRRGLRVRDVVGHIDLMPTILDAMGVPAPHDLLRGSSLRPYLANGTPTRRERSQRALYGESWGAFALGVDHQPVPFAPPAFTVRLGPRKLTSYRHGDSLRYEAFDLEHDPREERNLYPTSAATFAHLRSLLDSYPGYSARVREKLQSTVPSDARPSLVTLSPDQDEKLRALGYLQ